MADDMLTAGLGKEGKLPTKEELLDAIQKMSELDEESKQKLIQDIMSTVPQGQPGMPPPPGMEAATTTSSITVEMLMLLSLISLVFLILGEIFLILFNRLFW